MKNYTEKEIIEYIEKLRKDLKNNWSAWGDASLISRERLINQLTFLKKMIKSPRRIVLNPKKKLFLMKEKGK